MEFAWAALFVLGVICMAIAVVGGPAYFVKIAWVLWAVAAVIWLVAGYGPAIPLSEPHHHLFSDR
jgi:hypothetical protein